MAECESTLVTCLNGSIRRNGHAHTEAFCDDQEPPQETGLAEAYGTVSRELVKSLWLTINIKERRN
eukprot:6018499-Amphidinium_carterae.1